MPHISRRGLLKFAGKVAFGLFAFVPASRALLEGRATQTSRQASAAEFPSLAAPVSPPAPNPADVAAQIREHYREGTITSVTAAAYALRTPDGHSSIVLQTESTVVWGGSFVKDIPAAIGDRVVAWGEPLPDGSLSAEKLWVNLVNLRGRATNVRPESNGLSFTLEDTRSGPVEVQMVAETDVNVRGDTILQPLGSRQITVKEEQYAQVIGRRLANGAVLAVTAYL